MAGQWSWGVVLFMPRREIELAMCIFARGCVFKNYDGTFLYLDQQALKLLCASFRVSKMAMMIRLRELGYLEDLPYYQFYNSLRIRRM